MLPLGYPVAHRMKTLEQQVLFIWRGQAFGHTLHFVARRDLTAEDSVEIGRQFSIWLQTPRFIYGRPGDFLPYNVAFGELLTMEIFSRSRIPVLAGRVQYALALAHDDAAVPSAAASIMVKWFTAYGGRGGTGRTFLGPVGARNYSNSGIGQMTDDCRNHTGIHWGQLPDAVTGWLGGDAGLRLALLHRRPRLYSDDPFGWYSYITDGIVPDNTFRVLGRRVPPVGPTQFITP